MGVDEDGMLQSQNTDPPSVLSANEDACSWANQTKLHMSSARFLAMEAKQQMERNATTNLDPRYAQKVQKQLRRKLAATSDLTQSLHGKVESVEAYLRKGTDSLNKLKKARSAKFAPLSVCQRRLEIREKRPPVELVRDALQEALETEQQILTESRQALLERVQVTTEALASLNAVKQEMLEDLYRKRQGAHIDHICLLDSQHRGERPAQELLRSPRLHDVVNSYDPLSPQGAEAGLGPSIELRRKEDVRDRLSRAEQLELDADAMLAENERIIAYTKRECERAGAQSQSLANAKVVEMMENKKRLEQQLKDTEKTITVARSSLEKTTKKMKQHEAPLQILSRQFELRCQRTFTENIRDNVHEGLEDHLSAAKKSVHVLGQHVDGTQNLVEQMEATKRHIMEALKHKMAALRLDDECKRVSPKSAAEHALGTSVRGRADRREGSPRSPRSSSPRARSPRRVA